MKRFPIALILAIAFAGFACGNSAGPTAQTPPGSDRGPVTARVNGVPIYKVDFEIALQNFMESSGMGADAPEDKKKEAEKSVLDGMIGSELLFQKAQAIPVEVPQTEVDQALTQTRQGMGEDGLKAELEKRKMTEKELESLIRHNMTIQKMIQQTIVGTTVVSDDEMRRFYSEHLPEMQEPEYVDASHILAKAAPGDPADKKQAARVKIDGALKRVKGGEDFGAVAKEVSEDSSAPRGGVLGTVHRGQTIPAFEAAAFKLESGQISEVVETDFGYHIIKVTGKHPAGTAPFERAKEKIGEFLKHQKSQQAIENLVSSLRTAAKVEIL
ncbi:MAG TPA: peptidylprolyl isomerase [Candidatus Polarisedimenticolia bacterium]|jgi:peptidyl-prolyl cis-trans isomerase C